MTKTKRYSTLEWKNGGICNNIVRKILLFVSSTNGQVDKCTGKTIMAYDNTQGEDRVHTNELIKQKYKKGKYVDRRKRTL